jgi:hypothetical protein
MIRLAQFRLHRAVERTKASVTSGEPPVSLDAHI